MKVTNFTVYTTMSYFDGVFCFLKNCEVQTHIWPTLPWTNSDGRAITICIIDYRIAALPSPESLPRLPPLPSCLACLPASFSSLPHVRYHLPQ